MEEGEPPSPQAHHPNGGLVKRLRAAGVGDHDVRLVEQLLLLVAPPATSSESVSTTGGRHTPPSSTPPTTDIVRATPPRAIQMVGRQMEAPPDYEAGALLAATIRGDLPTVQRWLGAGIDPNAAHELLADWSPLHYAAQLGHVEIIAALLDHSAHPQPADRHGETPLMQAGYWGRRAAAELLMEHGGGTLEDVPPSMIVSVSAVVVVAFVVVVVVAVCVLVVVAVVLVAVGLVVVVLWVGGCVVVNVVVVVGHESPSGR